MSAELTLRRLAIFAAIARSGSLRAAAEELHLTQPAISVQLKALETALGVRLVDRDRTGSQATSVGRQLLPKVEDLLASVERLAEYSGNLRDGEEGVISIACYPVHIERFLATVLRDFHQEHPRVRIDLTKVRDDRRRNVGRSLFDELATGEVDLAMGPPHLQLGLKGTKAYDARIVVLFPDDHDLRSASEVAVDVLEDAPLLVAPPLFFSRIEVEKAAQSAGFVPRIAAESSSPPALFALGRAGIGIPVLPDDYAIVIGQDPPYPALVDHSGKEVSTPVWLQWRPGETGSAAVESLKAIATRWSHAEAKQPGSAAVQL